MQKYTEPQGPTYTATMEGSALVIKSYGSPKHLSWERIFYNPSEEAITAVEDPNLVSCWGGFWSTNNQDIFIPAE